MRTKLFNGDCLEVMDMLIKKGIKVDAIITDPPYGTTTCKWDSVIQFDSMWSRLKLLRNDKTPIVLFGSEPFSSALRMSNIKEYKYDWKWEKEKAGNFQNAKRQPMKKQEDICVFYKQFHIYNAQNLVRINKVIKNNATKSGSMNILNGIKTGNEYIQEFTNYPTEVLKFNNEKGFHESQKPVALLEYLIKTYTNEGEIVLDFTMGSGTTGVACINTNRDFIGIELDDEYFKIAENRINEAVKNNIYCLTNLV